MHSRILSYVILSYLILSSYVTVSTLITAFWNVSLSDLMLNYLTLSNLIGSYLILSDCIFFHVSCSSSHLFFILSHVSYLFLVQKDCWAAVKQQESSLAKGASGTGQSSTRRTLARTERNENLKKLASLYATMTPREYLLKVGAHMRDM